MESLMLSRQFCISETSNSNPLVIFLPLSLSLSFSCSLSLTFFFSFSFPFPSPSPFLSPSPSPGNSDQCEVANMGTVATACKLLGIDHTLMAKLFTSRSMITRHSQLIIPPPPSFLFILIFLNFSLLHRSFFLSVFSLFFSLLLFSFSSRGEEFVIHLKDYEAVASRDSFCKTVYARLFGWIVGSINQLLHHPNETRAMIGEQKERETDRKRERDF